MGTGGWLRRSPGPGTGKIVCGVVAVSEYREARRVFKQVKNGIKTAEDLTPREYGLLYLHFPFSLPDVERQEVEIRGG